MRFDIITIFPQMFGPYLNESILKRAQEKKLISIRIHNLRDFTRNKHKKVDDRPYGGGPGMVISVEPFARALKKILRGTKHNTQNKKQTQIILFSASGKQFTSKMASGWAKKYDRIIMIAGRYEGVDERISKVLQATSYKLQAISIGPYVLTGGELPALVVIDAVSRHIPGVLGREESLEELRHGVGVATYTRPEVFPWEGRTYRVPKILLSGDQKKIAAWRAKK